MEPDTVNAECSWPLNKEEGWEGGAGGGPGPWPPGVGNPRVTSDYPGTVQIPTAVWDPYW